MAEEKKVCCCSGKRKVRERTEEEALLQRLSRIEGQVRGVRGMVENSAYCTDILTQVSAIQSALNAFNRERAMAQPHDFTVVRFCCHH